MIEGEDEYAQKNKGGPLRVHRSYSNLKNKTNQMMNKENRTKNDVEIDCNRDLATPQLRFLLFFFSLISLNAEC